jgi:hypothetical protein
MSDATRDDAAPGWDAIDAALKPLYGDAEPLHYGTVIKYMIGGRDPLDGISIYKNPGPPPHWHFVSYGMSELYAKESQNQEFSGFGYEFTMRLARDPAEEKPPIWPIGLMQNLARASYEGGSVFGQWHTLNANGPIALETDTKLTAVVFVRDPQLPPIDTPHGRVEFLQIAGMTAEELAAKNAWDSEKLVGLLALDNPLLVTDLARASITDSPQTLGLIEEGIDRDGSSCGMLYLDSLTWRKTPLLKRFTIHVGAANAEPVARLLRGRTLHGRPFSLHGREAAVVEIAFEPAERAEVVMDEPAKRLVVRLSPAAARELMTKLRPQRGAVELAELPGLTVQIEPTHIRDDKGNVVRAIG